MGRILAAGSGFADPKVAAALDDGLIRCERARSSGTVVAILDILVEEGV